MGKARLLFLNTAVAVVMLLTALSVPARADIYYLVSMGQTGPNYGGMNTNPYELSYIDVSKPNQTGSTLGFACDDFTTAMDTSTTHGWFAYGYSLQSSINNATVPGTQKFPEQGPGSTYVTDPDPAFPSVTIDYPTIYTDTTVSAAEAYVAATILFDNILGGGMGTWIDTNVSHLTTHKIEELDSFAIWQIFYSGAVSTGQLGTTAQQDVSQEMHWALGTAASVLAGHPYDGFDPSSFTILTPCAGYYATYSQGIQNCGTTAQDKDYSQEFIAEISQQTAPEPSSVVLLLVQLFAVAAGFAILRKRLFQKA